MKYIAIQLADGGFKILTYEKNNRKQSNVFVVCLISYTFKSKAGGGLIVAFFLCSICMRDIQFTHRQIIPALTLPQFVGWHA